MSGGVPCKEGAGRLTGVSGHHGGGGSGWTRRRFEAAVHSGGWRWPVASPRAPGGQERDETPTERRGSAQEDVAHRRRVSTATTWQNPAMGW
jgi:hypothetical protein